jgi:hypothetical protein
MPSTAVRLRRRVKAALRDLRGAREVARAFVSTDHPLLAHIIPIRRCNLACEYCNEYDDFSKPVPLETMFRRIDKLAELGTSVVTISGGEPLLHPELDDVISRIRHHGMVAGLITNGYLLVPERIERLNRAGLEWLQISIDNVTPDDVSKKSLKVLDKKLQLLAEYADFHININSVVGGGVSNPQDALTIGKRAMELGFSSTVGIIHDGQGPGSAAQGRGTRRLPRDEKHGEAQLHAHQFFPGQHLARTAQPVALPRRRAISLYLRRRARPLLLASSVAILEFLSRSIQPSTSGANTSPKNPVLRIAPCHASTRSPYSMPGAPPQHPPEESPTTEVGELVQIK